MFEINIIKGTKPTGNPVIHERLAVRAVIRENGKLLMVETNRGDYKFPGGGVEAGETKEEALLREIREETGYVDITPGDCIVVAYEENEDTEEAGTWFQMRSIYYECNINSHKRAPGIQDDYEEKLGFHGVFVTVKEAFAKNRALAKQYTFEEIPWLERETKVLERL